MTKHPATYSNNFIPIFAELLIGCENVLDVFAGVGKLALIKEHGYSGKVVCNELEPEWANTSTYAVDEWRIGDAASMLWANDSSFDAICTSPTYGNRMADHHYAKDASKRITYTHFLGRPLDERNTGRMQWGAEYCNKHIEVYRECKRVLKSEGLMIVNISDHIRQKRVVNVAEWHKSTLSLLGFTPIKDIIIETRRMGFGSNAKSRVPNEWILVFKNNKKYQ